MSSRRYDVFLSFRGEDCRNFCGHLFTALEYQGYTVFRDDALLKPGQSLSSGLFKAIEDSTVSIVVFSKNYAGSRWCLDELVKIMDCHRSSGQRVVPVFYDVEPSEVRNQAGPFEAAFTQHEQIHQIGLVSGWKAALKEAANLAGLHLQNDSNGDEPQFVQRIVKLIPEIFGKMNLHVADSLVGIESHLRRLNGLLSLGTETDDVPMVVIWGLAGIGKTTIAKAIFNKCHRFFDRGCFLADVGETAKRVDGMIRLQETLIFDVFKQKPPNIANCHQGIEMIKQRLWRYKVFLVLDGVDNIEQLRNLAINPAWLHPSSRVIITTRDRSCVRSLDVKLYEADPLDWSNSVKLFNRYAFGDHSPKEGYDKLVEDAVDYAKGLPLVLMTLGSHMKGLPMVEWVQALERLKVIPSNDIQQIMERGYDSLDFREKELFLDIVGFFVGMDKDFMFQVLAEHAPGIHIHYEFMELLNRCLVKITEDGKIWVHDILRYVCRRIAHEVSSNDPENCLRLWHPENALRILKKSTGKKRIESIILELPDSNEEQVDINTFASMSELRLVRFRNVNLVGTYNGKQALDKLRWLSWYGCPLACIPSNLDMRNLVALHLQKSRLRQLWKGTKVMNKLKFLDVSDSYFLTSTPDFSGVVNLEKLWLRNCINLVEVHHSIERLHSLAVLDVSGCHKLSEAAGLEVSYSNVRYLVSSMLSWTRWESRASNLGSTIFSQGPSSLTKLNLSNCSLTDIQVEIGSLVSLVHLCLCDNKFSSIPSSIKNLHRLQILDVHGCCELKSISGLPSNLIVVLADGCQSLETVEIVSEMSRKPLLLVSEGTKLIDSIFINKGQVHALSRIHVVLAEEIEKGIPHWFNYQGLGPFLSFVVPEHCTGSIGGSVICVYYPESKNELVDFMFANVYNKTKDMMHTISLCCVCHTTMRITYVEFSEHGIVVDGGDEIEIMFVGTSLLNTCGLRLVYNEDEGVEVDDEQLVIQYSPDVYLHYDENTSLMEYTSPVMMAQIKPMLHDFKQFQEESVLVLVKEIAAGGGGSIQNAHSQMYHTIANAFYALFLQSSASSSVLWKAIDKLIEGYEAA